jgi:2-methylisocitrate lyase-like PEP mutase family enzyme
MDSQNQASRLRELLDQPGVLTVPGCYDAFSALMVEKSGFPCAYMTGFGSSASVIGQPDAGLMDFTQMSTHAGNLANCIGIPLIADGDTGYGNAINVHRTVKTYAKLGVAAIQLEDQSAPKRCGHVQGKVLVPLKEMLGKIQAAKDAAAEKDILIIARTDARAVDGFQAALDRCKAFEEGGADVIFLEAPKSIGEMRATAELIQKPLLANMVEGGETPFLGAEDLDELGFKIGLYPVTLLLSVAQTLEKQLKHLQKGKHQEIQEEQFSFNQLKNMVGFPNYNKMQEKYGS